MSKRLISGAVFALILAGLLTLTFNIKQAKGEWTGTVYIRANGSIDPPDAPIITYDKVTYGLMGNITSLNDGIVVERDSIILDGKGYTLSGAGNGDGILLVNRNKVILRNLKIKSFEYGIFANSSGSVAIYDSAIKNCHYGILLLWTANSIVRNVTSSDNLSRGIWIWLGSNNNSIIGCTFANNGEWGVDVAGNSNNTVVGNTVMANYRGVWLWQTSNIKVFHNNIINNVIQGYTYLSTQCSWDDEYPSGGNYWSNYYHVDYQSGSYQNETGSDGIGDEWFIIDEKNQDRYPLKAPFNTFNAGVWNGKEYNVDIVSNSSISNFHFDSNEGPFLRFNVNGTNGTYGFCRVTIPKDLLWVDDGWTITVSDQPITNYREMEDQGNTYLYFTYNHSTKTVTIKGTNVIPEFPSTPILMLLMLTTLITTTLWKTKRKRQPP